MYKPPEPEPPAELPQATATACLSRPCHCLAARRTTFSAMSSSPPTGTAVVYKDIANFDVGFHISYVESDYNDDFDTSADIFL